MRVTLVLLVLLKSVISNEESDEKYIDLLPEEEKRQFLEKIARRILEDYQNNNEPNASHVDISDDELDAHSAYVQGLLQEETQNLRKNNEPQRRDDKQDTVKVEDNRKISAETDKNFVDLTLRAGKRDKRGNTSKEHSTQEQVIPVIPVYDEVLHVKNKPTITTSGNNREQNTTTNIVRSEDPPTLNKNSNVLRNSYTYDDEDSKNENDHESNERLRSTVIDNFEPSKESDDDSSKQKTIEETTTDLILNDTVRSAESPRYGVRERDLTRKDNVQRHEYNDNIETTSDKELISKDMTSTNPVISTSSTTEQSTTDKQQILDESYNTSRTTNNNTTTGGLKLIDLDINNFNVTRETINTDFTKKNLTESTINEEISTTTEIYTQSTTNESNLSTTANLNNISTTSAQEINKQNVTINCNETDKNKNENRFNNESKRTIFDDMDLFESRQESNIANIVKSEETIIKGIERIETVADGVKENSNEYYVYEISAEKPPFKSRPDDEEQVYYAPVYNYAPEFAYYDPHNRFGPNTDDISKDSYEKPRNKNERRNKIKNQGNNNDNRDKFNNIFNILKQHNYNNVVDPQTIVQNSAIFNPNDYIDMDYFFGRNDDANLRSIKYKKEKTKYYFPDTEEDDHPYQSMKNSLQDHIRAVRKLLFEHKQFGYIPERPKLSNDDETRLRSRLKHSDANNFGQNRDDITIDYYFGRKSSHEADSEHNKLFKLHLAHLKEGSVTPKPVKEKRLDLKEMNEKDDFDVYVNVLRDMIEMDNEALVKYDWLRSAVDIRTALSKLKDLTKKLKNNDHIHPNDLELLKYVIYLYKSANESHQMTLSVELLKTITQLRKNKKKSVMPQIKKKQKFRSAIKLWRDFRTFLRSLINGERDKRDTVGQFERFLTDLEDHLNGFHNAIKSIASITKFKKQNWYADLKEVYLKNATKRELLEVILHLGLSRLLALIEDSSESGLEENFSNYVYNNGKEVNVTRRDFIFVLRLLNAMKEIN